MFPLCNISIETPDHETYALNEYNSRELIQSLRNVLALYYETCYYTHYAFLSSEDKEISDMTEICSLIPVPESNDNMELQLTLKIKLLKYNDKAAREHVQRVRTLMELPLHLRSFRIPPIDIPPKTQLAKPSNGNNSTSNVITPISIPHDADIGNFAKETLLTFSDKYGVKEDSNSMMSDVVKSITYSGYNPLPSTRALHGELFFLEISTSDGTLFVSATSNGFYVNRSSRSQFDPSPQAHPSFSHELLLCLIQHNPKVKDSWVLLSQRPFTPYSPMQGILMDYQSGKLQRTMDFLSPTWINGSKPHSYSLSRAMDHFSDSLGVEEKGPPREWNEEVQSLRFLEGKATMERLSAAKYIHKTNVDFYEASKRLVVAIIDGGFITPLNPTDPPALQIYIYNNLFVSRAAESPETFKLCKGEEAIRKSTGRDFRNLSVIELLGMRFCPYLKIYPDLRNTRVVHGERLRIRLQGL